MTTPLTTAVNATPWGSIAVALLVGTSFGATVMYALLRRPRPYLHLPSSLLQPGGGGPPAAAQLPSSTANEEEEGGGGGGGGRGRAAKRAATAERPGGSKSVSSLVISDSDEADDGRLWLRWSERPGDQASTAEASPTHPYTAGKEALNVSPANRADGQQQQQKEEKSPHRGQQDQQGRQSLLQQQYQHEHRRSRRRSSLQYLLKSYMSATEAESLYSDLVNDDSMRASFSEPASANLGSDHGDVREGSNSWRGNSVHSLIPRTTETDSSDFSTVDDLLSHEVSSSSSEEGDNDNDVENELHHKMYLPSPTDNVMGLGQRKESDLLQDLHRSSSGFCQRNQSYSTSTHPIDGQIRMRLSSERDSVFSNRQFYHTVSGAIISRLPSEPSIRRMSIRQLLHSPPLLRSSKDDVSPDDGSGTSHSALPPSPPSRRLNQFPSHSLRSVPDEPIYRIVITGGPCSGKTSCLAYLREVFVNLGFNVFCVPEVATLLHTGGVNLLLSSPEDRITQQRVILQMMMMLEDAFYELASLRGRPSLILYDRGTMDGSAYCSEEEWRTILLVTGYTNEELCDVRYDAVVHLVTAADGAESYYTLANNAARSEGLEEARCLDTCTRNAWRGHFLVGVVDNTEDGFDGKLHRTAEFIAGVMGITLPSDKQHTEMTTESGTDHSKETMRASITQEEKEKKKDTMESNNSNNNNSTGIHQFPLGTNTLVPNTHNQPAGATLNVFGVCDHLQRHFFVTRVNTARIPADAIVTTVVVVPLSPLHPDYRSETIIRLSRAHDSHPVYFRCVEFNDTVDPLPPSAAAATVTSAAETTTSPLKGEKQKESGQTTTATAILPHRRARVQITKSTFRNLAQRRDISQPVICKTMTRFFYNMRHLTLVRFSHPRELRGFCRLVAPAGTTEEDFSDLVVVEPFFLLKSEETSEEK
ncbi:uncharacterized protein TM35_000271770 [Trypanosoma theileri]|uniref:NadR/Ttd14 AAA domain-containing protein n=1 Tax=Trypanosoma theileri TaxID=67003 RepID=A0A1X0NPH4_9TRYP|nr:uncharacterized protein TM35_000271770 [Trypanosoma theileri]ORC86587.1 hypothetical protein TM35_000271770 [Trypanosoma theileri]